jgi:signal transduction histidine kinase
VALVNAEDQTGQDRANGSFTARLLRSIRSLVQEPTIEQVGAVIAREVAGALGAPAAGLWVVDAGRADVFLLVSHGFTATTSVEVLRQPLGGATPLATVVRTRESLAIPDFASTSMAGTPLGQAAPAAGWGSALITPACVGDQVVGLVGVFWCGAHAISKTDRDRAGAFADLWGTAIDGTQFRSREGRSSGAERTSVQSATRRLVEQQEALGQVAQALVRETNLAQVADVVIQQGLRVLGASVVGVWVAEPGPRTLELIAQRGKQPHVVSLLQHLSFDASAISALAARTGQMQVAEDVGAMSNQLAMAQQVAAAEKAKSVLSVPLKSHGQLVGVVTYAFPTTRHFEPGELGFIRTLSDLFATAIESAQLNQRLNQLVQQREEFLASAAHELRTPLTVIKGESQLTLKNDAREPQSRRTLETVLRQSDRIARLVDDLLAVLRLRPGDFVPVVEVFDLGQLVRDQIRALGAERGAARLQVEGPLPVRSDRRLVAEVIERLLEAAEQYSPPGVPIDVRAARQDGNAVVSVTDYGVGVPAERRPNVFEPFYLRVPPGKLGYIGTVSLGLYLANQMAIALAGRLWLASEPGKGTTLSFSLPIASALA